MTARNAPESPRKALFASTVIERDDDAARVDGVPATVVRNIVAEHRANGHGVPCENIAIH